MAKLEKLKLKTSYTENIAGLVIFFETLDWVTVNDKEQTLSGEHFLKFNRKKRKTFFLEKLYLSR